MGHYENMQRMYNAVDMEIKKLVMGKIDEIEIEFFCFELIQDIPISEKAIMKFIEKKAKFNTKLLLTDDKKLRYVK